MDEFSPDASHREPTPDTLVVIATHNGKEHLTGLLESIAAHPVPADIAVIDTGSTDDATKPYVGRLYPKDINHYDFIEGGYCTRAYLHAFSRYPEYGKYILMHDSMRVKAPHWASEFQQKLEAFDLVGWISFPLFFDTLEQEAYIRDRLHIAPDDADMPRDGIFGPIFGIRRDALAAMAALNLLPVPPNSKMEECGWERGWAVAAHKARLSITFLHAGISWQGLVDDLYGLFTKVRPGRQ